MRRVLIDTVGFLALWNARDPWHAAAVDAFKQITSEGADFCTTEFILLECANAASRTPFRSDVIDL